MRCCGFPHPAPSITAVITAALLPSGGEIVFSHGLMAYEAFLLRHRMTVSETNSNTLILLEIQGKSRPGATRNDL